MNICYIPKPLRSNWACDKMSNGITKPESERAKSNSTLQPLWEDVYEKIAMQDDKANEVGKMHRALISNNLTLM